MLNKLLFLLIAIVAIIYGVFPGLNKARDSITHRDAPAAIRTQTQVDFAPIVLADYEDGEHRGHTIARHVGKSDAWLKQRLIDSERIPAASSFADEKTANKIVNAVLKARWSEIEAWLESENGRQTFNARKRFDEPTGRGIARGDKDVSDYYSAIVRMEKSDASKTGFVIWSAYPTE